MISTCPRCEKQVSIPAGVDPTALVRCPLCVAEYALSEALDWGPPELIPVGRPVAEGAASAVHEAAAEPAGTVAAEHVEAQHDTEAENEAAAVSPAVSRRRRYGRSTTTAETQVGAANADRSRYRRAGGLPGSLLCAGVLLRPRIPQDRPAATPFARHILDHRAAGRRRCHGKAGGEGREFDQRQDDGRELSQSRAR